MSVDRFGVRKKLLGQVLKEMKLIHEGQVQEALQVQKKEGGQIGQILVRQGHVTDAQLMLALGRQSGLEVLDLKEFEPQSDAIEKVDESIARPFQFVPVTFDGKTLVVAMADPMNKSALDDIRFTANCDVKGVVADGDQIAAAIEKAYGKEENVMATILQEIEEGGLTPAPTAKKRRTGLTGAQVTDLEDAEEMANSAPVRKLLNYILYQAIRDRASDIHLEPFEDEFKIRYRVDGVLYELEAPPLHLATALIRTAASTSPSEAGPSTCACRRCRPCSASPASCASWTARSSASSWTRSACARTTSTSSSSSSTCRTESSS
jgi:type IV pilus assembly protein PilB